MMKVIPVPSATIARVESGAEGEGALRKTVCGLGSQKGRALRCREQTHLKVERRERVEEAVKQS